MTSKYGLFTEFMRDYIELQEDQNEPPWCMSIELLTQAFKTFVLKVKNQSMVIANSDEQYVYQLLREYINDEEIPSSNINIFGFLADSNVPKVTATGIRLKKVPTWKQ